MYHRVSKVQKLLLVYRPVHSLEVSRRRAQHRVFNKRRLHHVYLRLAVLAQVYEAVAAGAALHREQAVEHEGIKPVLV